MTEDTFKKILSQFLERYWGAFHEALEAQSVTPRRLAGSLAQALKTEHEAFESVYVGPARSAIDGLGLMWKDLEARRYRWPDPVLTHDDVTKALALFTEIYDSLIHEGRPFAAARNEILTHASHGTPRQRLRADAAR